MSATPPLPVRDPADLLAEGHRLALKMLREQGMDIASRLHAASQEPDADLGDIAGKFARVARAVRQTILLEARFSDDDLMRRREAARRAAELRTERGRVHKRAVMTAASAVFSATRKRSLSNDFAVRLERLNDHDPDFPDRPVEDVIAEICQALGVQNPIESKHSRSPYLPRAAVGGGPNHPLKGVDRKARGADAHSASEAERSEEPLVEGAGQAQPPPAARSSDPSPDPPPAQAACSFHPPLSTSFGGRSPSPAEAGAVADNPRTTVNWGGPTPDTG